MRGIVGKQDAHYFSANRRCVVFCEAAGPENRCSRAQFGHHGSFRPKRRCASGLNLISGRLLITASYFEAVRAVMSQSNWRFRTGGSVLDEGSGSPSAVGELL